MRSGPVDESLKTIEGPSYRVLAAQSKMSMLRWWCCWVILTPSSVPHQWQNQAQYEMGEGETCGFLQTDYRDGEVEFVLYYAEQILKSVHTAFHKQPVRAFLLSRHELDISRYQLVQCDQCRSHLARTVVMNQLKKGKKFSFCHECGKKLQLPEPRPVHPLDPPRRDF